MDFSRLQRAIFYRPDFRSVVCQGCGSINLQSESAILTTSFSMKFESIATKAITVVPAEQGDPETRLITSERDT